MAGSPTLLPNGQFAFPRAYVEGLYVRHDPGAVTWDGELLTFIVAGPPDALVRVWFDTRFSPWSSNRWTLDHLTVDASYEYPTGGQIRPLPYYVYWTTPPGRFRPHVGIDAQYGSAYTIIELPIPPDEYWVQAPYHSP